VIRKDSPLPIYYQLEQGIKELIESGKFTAGDLIPSEREFANDYQISRMTVRQAITNLVNDGYLKRERGKGTFVAYQKIEKKGLTGFSEDMHSRGLKPGTKVLDFTILNADAKNARHLEIQEGSLIYQVKRLRLADNEPMAYEILLMSTDLVPGLTEEIVCGSIYEYVEKQAGLHIVSGVQELEATTARKQEAELLQINEGAPVLLIQRKALLENKQPLEFVQSYYRADRYKFTIEISR
jgi:GntR family transcriptional regulator